MTHSDLLRYVAGVLNDLNLRYFITGSTATIAYGEPRLTNDIDVVVDLPESRVSEFCARFPSSEFYVSEHAALDAVCRHSQFNVIHFVSGLKIDVLIPSFNAFDESRFARRKMLPVVADLQIPFASPEDAIIKKMEYYREGGSEKHLRDIAGVLKTSNDEIDFAYIEKWSRQLGLTDIWTAIQQRMKQ